MVNLVVGLRTFLQVFSAEPQTIRRLKAIFILWNDNPTQLSLKNDSKYKVKTHC